MISLDRRYQQGDHPLEICAHAFHRHPHGTVIPRRILLAEADCERLAARGHILERYGYEVLSCCGIQSIEKCLSWMSHVINCDQLVHLIICDVHLLDEVLVGLIQRGQKQPHFPPLLLIVESGDHQAFRKMDRLQHQGCLTSDGDPLGQMLLVRQCAPY